MNFISNVIIEDPLKVYKIYNWWKQFENKSIRVELKNGQIFQGLLKNLDLLEMQFILLTEKSIDGEWRDFPIRRSEIKTVQEIDLDLYLLHRCT